MKMNKYFKYAVFILALLVLVGKVPAKEEEKGDIIVHLRLYEGSRGNEFLGSRVYSAYFLKPLFVSSLVSKMDIQEEEKELKRIFNLTGIKLMTRTQWGWKYGKTEKRFRLVVLNGHTLMIRLTMKGNKNGFKVEVRDKDVRGNANNRFNDALLDTNLELPQNKSTVFGFEDSLRKPYFICLQREENQSVIDKEPTPELPERPRLVKRVQPEYPEEALTRKLQGEIILDAETDVHGNVAELQVIEGVEGLTKAALNAVRQWKYDPFVKDGKAQPVRFTVIIHFTLPVTGNKWAKSSGSPGDAFPYHGEPMDFNFKNADLMDILTQVARKTDVNIVVDPGLEGYRVSCQLKQVPWDQALDWMMQLNGLDMIFKGNVLRITKAGPASKKLKKSLTKKNFRGDPIKINFKDADLRDVLGVLAKIGNVQLKMTPDVTGRVTLNMEKVPWEQVMELVLQVNGLDMTSKGNVIHVFKPDEPSNKYSDKKNISAVPATLPVKGFLKEGFGWRNVNGTQNKRFNSGIDIAAKRGTPVIAPQEGVVSAVKIDKDYGRLIEIDHGSGYITRFGQLAGIKVKKGEKVTKGQVIALIGHSEENGSFYLHYEVRFNGKPVNPLTVARGN